MRSFRMNVVPAAALAVAFAAWFAAPSAIRAEDPVVRQAKSTFAPETMTVAKGQKVRFLNDDTITHNVLSRTAGAEFNLGSMKPGDSAERAFDKPGPVDVRCAIHPRMRLTIQVTE